MNKFQAIAFSVVCVISINSAEARKHRILMDMAEIGVARYAFKHEMHKAEEKVLMQNGEKISLRWLLALNESYQDSPSEYEWLD